MNLTRTASRPLRGLRLALAGAGRVGLSLVAWAQAAGGRAVAVGTRSEASRQRAAQVLGAERVTPLEELTSADTDLLLVAVGDPVLDAVAVTLALRAQAPIVLHVAGSRDASALAPLAAGGVHTGSLHPLRAFPRPLLDPTAGQGIVFATDGDAPAVDLAWQLATAFGGTPVAVPAAQRRLYHFAATLAAGGVVTLLATAAELVRALELDPAVERGYLELARGAVEAAAAAPEPTAAITGPVARGDRDLVFRQLEALAQTLPALTPLARELALQTLRLLLASGPPSAPQREAQRALFVELAATRGNHELP
jgi:predicted short-subunit dehydrogenase-like oxidoreductase (DUF2520 family)